MPFPTPPHKNYGRLTRGWVKYRVLRDLAQRELTHAQIAKKYDVTTQAVNNFKNRHRAEFDELVREIEDEFAGLWIADKRNRIAEYQQMAEDVSEAMAQLIGGPGEGGGSDTPTILGVNDLGYIKEQVRIMKAVAEELGQLPNRSNSAAVASAVVYQFEGIDPEDLK